MFYIFFLVPILCFGQVIKGLDLGGTSAPPKIVEGNTYAVIVGINNYTSPKITKLNYAASDAIAFEQFLLSKAGGHVPKENIRRFLNDSATTGKFKKLGLSWVKSKAKKGDRVYLYFSGHGITVSGGDSYFLAHNLASDFSVENIEEAGTQALYQLKTNTIRPLCDSGVQVILIIDACRSHLAETLGSATVTTFNPDFNSAEMNVGDIMLLSSRNGQASLETDNDNIRHGVFTYYLLQGLYGMADNGKKADGLVTLNKLNNYVTKMVSDYTNESQIPLIYHKGAQNPVIAIVDSNLLASHLKSLKQPGNELAVNTRKGNAKGFFTSKYSYLDTIGLYDNFLTRLSEGKLWGDTGALYQFSRMEKFKFDIRLLNDAALSLSSVLVDSGQFIMNSYLAADKKVFKNQGPASDYQFVKGAAYFDTLYKICSRYFPGDNDNKDYLQQYYFMKGRSLLNAASRAEKEKALDLLNTAYSLDSSAYYILHVIDIFLEDLGLPEMALENQQRVIEKYPKWTFAYNSLGNILYELKRYEEALAAYYKAIGLDSLYATPWIGIGNYYTDIVKDFNSAKNYYLKSLSLDANYEVALGNLGNLFYQLKEYDSAMYFLQRAISINPRDDYNLNKIGDVYKASREYDSAKYYYSKALEIDLAAENTMVKIGNIFYDGGEYDSATYYYKKAIAANPKYEYAWANLGGVFKNSSKYDSARYCYDRAIGNNPTYDYAWNEIGNLYNYYLDEYDSSIIYYHKAMALNDKEWVYPSNLGRAYLNLGKLDSSAYYYWKAINLPNSNISHCFESLLDIYTNDTGDLADIEKIFIWLTTAPVSKGSLWERLGDTYFASLKNLSRAEQCYQKAYEIDSADRYQYKIVDLKYAADPSQARIDLLAKVMGHENDVNKKLVEYGRYLNYAEDARLEYPDYNYPYNDSLITNFKKQGNNQQINSYLKTLVDFDSLRAESWIKLAGEYKTYKLSKGSIIRFLKTSIRLDSAASEYEAWPELCSMQNSFVPTAVAFLEKQKAKTTGESYMLYYNLARCYYYANNFTKAAALLTYANKNFVTIKINREEFIKMPASMWSKIWR